MGQERFLGDLIKELNSANKSGALYIDIVETSEDMFKIYFENGSIYHIRVRDRQRLPRDPRIL